MSEMPWKVGSRDLSLWEKYSSKSEPPRSFRRGSIFFLNTTSSSLDRRTYTKGRSVAFRINLWKSSALD